MEVLIVCWGLLAAYILYEYEFLYADQSTGVFFFIVTLLIATAPAITVTHIVMMAIDCIMPEGWDNNL